MSKNVGTIDRVIRIVAALAAVVAYFSGSITGGLWLGVAGVFTLIWVVTSATSVCPLYTVVGINTRGE